jgi:hypothetical protein
MIPKQTRITAWLGPLPEPGEFLRSQGGSLYLVLSRRDNTRPKHVRKSRCVCHLGKLEHGEELPGNAVVHDFQWNGRGRS